MRYVEITEAYNKERPLRPSAADLARIRQIRHEIRCEEGAGGQCGWVVEWCQNEFNWCVGAQSGTYCNDADEPICCDHAWCILPDGAIFDPTADQMGLGHDMRIVEPGDPDFHKYRWQWHPDYHPGREDSPELKDTKWSGKFDDEWAREIRAERGEDWHVTDKKQYAAYMKKHRAYDSGRANPKKPLD
jgi:hypothetical protein